MQEDPLPWSLPVEVPSGGGSFRTSDGRVHMPASYGMQQIHGNHSSFSYTFETTLSNNTLEPGGKGTTPD